VLHTLRLSSVTVLATLLASAVPASAADVIVGLVTKTNTNPFFVKMKEGAEAKAKELGVKLSSFAGKVDGDNQSQVEAIESLIAAGAKGILLVPSDSTAIVPTVQKARHRQRRELTLARCGGFGARDDARQRRFQSPTQARLRHGRQALRQARPTNPTASTRGRRRPTRCYLAAHAPSARV